MPDCIFCRILSREVPSKIIYEDDTSAAFEDVRPEAPHHFLVIPKRHLPSLAELGEMDEASEALLGHLLLVASKVARERGLDAGGYRVVINTGEGAGQTVFHLHVHVLGGRAFHWPPG